MLKPLLLLLLAGWGLGLVLQAVTLGYAYRAERQRAQLYRELRVYITGADSLATRLRWAEGALSQCRAYF